MEILKTGRSSRNVNSKGTKEEQGCIFSLHFVSHVGCVGEGGLGVQEGNGYCNG